MYVTEDTYSSTLSRNRFLYFEMKTIAELKLTRLSETEIRYQVKVENLFQYKTPSGIAKSLNTAIKRIDAIDDTLLKMLAQDGSEIGKLIVSYSIWKMDNLLRDFFVEVLLDKFLTRQYHLENADIHKFFIEKADQSKVVASWTDRTLKDLRKAYRRVLIEIRIATNDSREIHPILIPAQLLNYLINTDGKEFVAVLTGEKI
jgi:hypothetical protein